MNDERKNSPARFVADAALHLGIAERCLRSARRAGANGDAHLFKLEAGARDLRRLARECERGA